MIVTKILREVDAELERLQTARDTIAALISPERTERKKRSLRPTAEAMEPQVPMAPIEAAREAAVIEAIEAPSVRRRGRPKGSTNREPRVQRMPMRRVPEPTALTPALVGGPVFVSAAELERRKRAVVMPAPKPVVETPAEGTLDSLIREIAGRRAEAAA